MTTELRSRIIGTGSYISDEVLTNNELAMMVDTSDEWITGRTGIRERRIAPKGIHTSDMGVAALKHAVEMASLQPDDLDMIVCGTVTPDYPMPAAAPLIQAKLGMTKSCPAFDVSAACAGFLYALAVADSFIKQGRARYIGVIGSEALTRFVDFEDRTTCILFGDGAGAAILTGDTEGRGILSSHLFSNGGLVDALKIPAGGSAAKIDDVAVRERQQYIKMNGREVFKYAVRYLADASKEAFQANGMSANDIDWVVPHQANMRILEAVAKRIDLPLEKFTLNIERLGNTSSASIPIALDEAVRDGRITTGQNILMIALGAGVSWGSALLRW